MAGGVALPKAPVPKVAVSASAVKAPLPAADTKVKVPSVLPPTTDKMVSTPTYYSTSAAAAKVLPSDVPGAVVKYAAGKGYYVASGPASAPTSAGSSSANSPAALAAAELAPQANMIDQQSTTEQAAMRQFAAGILSQIKTEAPATAQAYDQAGNTTNALASTAANLLANANPNSNIQSLLQSVGAPQSQQDAVANRLANVFNGGGAVLYQTQGANAGSELAAAKAAQLGFANALPGIEGVAATDAERNLLYQTALQKSALAAQMPTLENQIAAAQATAAYRQSQLTIAGKNASTRAATLDFNKRQAAIKFITQNAVQPNGQLTPAGQTMLEHITGAPAGTFTGMDAKTAATVAHDKTMETIAQQNANTSSARAATTASHYKVMEAQGEAKLIQNDERIALSQQSLKLRQQAQVEKSKNGGISAGTYSSLKKGAAKAADLYYYGKTPTNAAGTNGIPGVDYQVAYQHLITDWSLKPADARAILAEYYAPGERGRPALTYAQGGYGPPAPKGK